jgi:hypothetical protein
MFLTRRIFAFALFLAVALAVAGGGDQLTAQRGRGGGGLGIYGFGPRLGENIQLALDNQDHLGLSGEQVASLQDLLSGIQDELGPLQAGIDDLRYRIIGGEVERVDGIESLQALLEDYESAAAPFRTEVTRILTADQHMELQNIMWATRPGPGTGWGAGPDLTVGTAPGLGPAPASAYGPGLGLGRGYYGGRGPGRGAGLGRGAGVRAGRGFYRGYPRGLGRRGWW